MCGITHVCHLAHVWRVSRVSRHVFLTDSPFTNAYGTMLMALLYASLPYGNDAYGNDANCIDAYCNDAYGCLQATRLTVMIEHATGKVAYETASTMNSKLMGMMGKG